MAKRLVRAEADSCNCPACVQLRAFRALSRRRRRRRRIAWACAGLVALAVCATAGVWVYSRSLLGELSAGPKRPVVEATRPHLGVEPAHRLVELPPATTFLLLGSDRRWGEGGHGRSDTMILARLEARQHRLALLSLPRDLLVNIPGHGRDKLNSAYPRGGVPLLVRTIREELGVRIDHFIELTFGGFTRLVSHFGGVYLPIDARYFHQSSPAPGQNWASIDLKPGYQKLGGEDALSWVRYRHTDSDFHRAARQQLFLREVGRQLRARLTNPVKIPSALRAVAKATTSDLDDLDEVLTLGRALLALDASKIERVTLQGQGQMINGVYYLIASDEQRRQALRRWAGTATAGKRKHRAARSPRPPQPARLLPDGGRARAILARLGRFRGSCTPTALPPGYTWPGQAARDYEVGGAPARALYATAGSGQSILWMWSRWADPPILERPTKQITRRGRRYALYREPTGLRMVAWRKQGTWTWITNTLTNQLSDAEMLALADSCR